MFPAPFRQITGTPGAHDFPPAQNSVAPAGLINERTISADQKEEWCQGQFREPKLCMAPFCSHLFARTHDLSGSQSKPCRRRRCTNSLTAIDQARAHARIELTKMSTTAHGPNSRIRLKCNPERSRASDINPSGNARMGSAALLNEEMQCSLPSQTRRSYINLKTRAK